jgi:hypothetical protein
MSVVKRCLMSMLIAVFIYEYEALEELPTPSST